MGSVLKIGITRKNNTVINAVKNIDTIKNKGIIGDRHFQEYNDPYNQISLIESENIDKYNQKYNLKIPHLDFRRNIVTKGIKLNDLVGKKILIGDSELEGIDLCRPCQHLQEILGYNNIIKEFLRSGGLRCQILKSGKINLNDLIQEI
jgi:MOSC domain-containing protein YiiM